MKPCKRLLPRHYLNGVRVRVGKRVKEGVVDRVWGVLWRGRWGMSQERVYERVWLGIRDIRDSLKKLFQGEGV